MTTDEERLILALSAQPEPGNDGYMTFREICRALSMSENRTRNLLIQLSQAGRLECKRVPRRTITGDVQAVPGYRLAECAVT